MYKQCVQCLVFEMVTPVTNPFRFATGRQLALEANTNIPWYHSRKYDGIVTRNYEGGIPRNIILGCESDIV